MREIFEGVDRWTAPDEPPITVRSLLTMTSNLPNFTLRPPAGADPWGAVATPQLLAALKALPPHGWPNTFEYSNTGYFLLASALDAVFAGEGRHTDFRGYVRAAIVSPLGLSQTGFVDDYAARLRRGAAATIGVAPHSRSRTGSTAAVTWRATSSISSPGTRR